jgi:hypothetical protein
MVLTASNLRHLEGAPAGKAPATAPQDPVDHRSHRHLQALPLAWGPGQQVQSPSGAGRKGSATGGAGGSGGEGGARRAICDIERFVEGCDDWSKVVITAGIEVEQHPRVLYLRDFSALQDLGVQLLRVSDVQPNYLQREDPSWVQAAQRTFASPDFFSRESAEFYVRGARSRKKQPPGGSLGWEVAKRPAGGEWGQAFLDNQARKGSVDPVTALMFPYPQAGPQIAVLHNVAINHLGDVQTQTGALLFLKGCFDRATRWQEVIRAGGIKTDNLQVHPEVISIVQRHTEGDFYHFLLDGLSRLPMVEDLLLAHPDAKLHIGRPVAGSEPWMGRNMSQEINFRQQEGFFENFQVPMMEDLGLCVCVYVYVCVVFVCVYIHIRI